jgi:hypothetical protein
MIVVERYIEQNHPVAAECREGRLWVTLENGLILSAPLEWYPALRTASPEALAEVQVTAEGTAWPNLDTRVSVREMFTRPRPNRAATQLLREWQAKDIETPLYNQAAIELLDNWLIEERDEAAEEDAESWEKLKTSIEENRLSYRKRFDD